MNNAPCREVGCHAGCERYKAYADGRKTALENRYTACIEGTGKKRSHEGWAKFQKKGEEIDTCVKHRNVYVV